MLYGYSACMRSSHFVGTVPGDGPAEAISLMLDASEGCADSYPDGENTMRRSDWVTAEIENRAQLPELITLRRSRMSDRNRLIPALHAPIYAVRPGHELPVDYLNNGHCDNAVIAASILQELAAQRFISKRPKLQVDIPGPLDLAAFSWGPQILRYYEGECIALLREIEAIHERLSGQVIFQLSIPLETYLIAKTPRSRQQRMAARLMKRLCDFVARTPLGCIFIVHFCDGDAHGKPIVANNSVGALVTGANELYYRWPHTTHTLHGVLLPFGNGAHAAPPMASHYWALRNLVLPPTVRLIAGFVAPGLASLDDQLDTLAAIEYAAHREVVISSPCGWGPRCKAPKPDVAALVERTQALAGAPQIMGHGVGWDI